MPASIFLYFEYIYSQLNTIHCKKKTQEKTKPLPTISVMQLTPLCGVVLFHD